MRRGNGLRLLARFLAYQIASWSVLGIVTRDLGLGAALVVALLALYTTIPLLLFVKWRGWPFYPGAAFRLLVVRAVLYSQLVLPFAAAAVVLGMLIGLPFGHALLYGRLLLEVVVGGAA